MRRREFMTLITGAATAGSRNFLPVFGGLAVLPFAGTDVSAEAWPARPVSIICPFPAGISTDLVSRMVATDLSDKLRENFIVENRPGATGNIGAAMVARAAPDGYTLLVATLGPAVTNKFEYKHLDFDPEQAFAPVALLAESPLFIVGTPKLPITDFKRLIAFAKQNPGRLNAGTVGVGSQAHIMLEMINKLAGVSIVHVPYRVFPQALTDLVSGDLQLAITYIPTFVPNAQSGMIRGLAVTSLGRVPDLPSVPTLNESGLPGFEAAGWNAMFTPAGTPATIVERLNAAVNAFLLSDTGRRQLQRIGMTALGGTPEKMRAYLKSEAAKWGPVIKEANIMLD
jgi:tripartite-type tricarboxylate transporter receptor subunit TctC